MSFFYRIFLAISLLNIASLSFCLSNPTAVNFEILKKDSVVQNKAAIIDHKRYIAINVVTLNDTTENKKFFIKDGSGKIVYTYLAGEVVSFKFTDFNGDGYKDIILELSGVDSGQQELLIYDPKSEKFRLAGNCSNAEKIVRTKYYYSYEDCCMGRDWSSNLFYISDSKIIDIGYIAYNDGYGISFYKVSGKKKIFLKFKTIE